MGPMSAPTPSSRAPGDAEEVPVPLLPVLVGATSLGAGVGVIFPLLAEFQDRYGFSAEGLGVLSAATFVAALVSGLLLAGLADRGRARLMMVGGIALSAVGLLWFAAGTELWQFTGARLLEGLGYGVFLPAGRKVVTAGDPAHAGQRLGRLTSFELGGFLAGPVIGSALSELVGLWAPLVLIGLFQAALAVWIATVRLPRLPVDVARGSALGSFRMLRRGAVAGAALLSLTIFLPVGIYDALWSRYLTDRGASTLFIGIGLSLYSLPIVLFAPAGGRLADRIGPVRATALGICLIIPTTITYGLLSVPLLITAVGLIEALPQSVATPAVQTAMLRACRPEEVAAGQGLAHAVNQIGAGTAALLGPVVYEAAGPAVLFSGVAGVMLLLFVLGLTLHRRGGGEAIAELV
jgi:MFS family permease